jgi:lipoprotein NlpD
MVCKIPSGSSSIALIFVVALNLVACSSSPRVPAPVEEIKATSARTIWNTSPLAKPVTATQTPLGIENEGKPGYYTVKSGDTLIRIGLDQGQNWRDLVKWNNLDNPNAIEVGQVLRVAPPKSNAPEVSTSSAVVVSPVQSQSPIVMNAPVTAPESVPGTKPSPNNNVSTLNSSPVSTGSDELSFAWPAQGNVINYFNESKNKGIDIGNKAGQAVLASADGKVVYAGSGLRGYGNLIILKHNETYLSAYAHNQVLLVKEDQLIKKGQKIAEMGNSDADQVALHFEIRKSGKPVDPMKYLPAQ